jgi:hypothetical protein
MTFRFCRDWEFRDIKIQELLKWCILTLYRVGQEKWTKVEVEHVRNLTRYEYSVKFTFLDLFNNILLYLVNCM